MSANHLPDRTTLSIVEAPNRRDDIFGDVVRAGHLLFAVESRFVRLGAAEWLETAKKLHAVLDEAQARSTRERLRVVS